MKISNFKLFNRGLDILTKELDISKEEAMTMKNICVSVIAVLEYYRRA